jgi:hypothetical protein
MFADLNTMAACLAQIGAIVLEAGREYLEKDYSIRPKFRAQASARLQELLGSISEAEAVLGVLESYPVTFARETQEFEYEGHAALTNSFGKDLWRR